MSESEDSDDIGICSFAIAKERRTAGDRGGRFDCRDVGPFASVHPVWMEHPAGDCRGTAGTRGDTWRREHVHSGSAAAFLYRLLGRSDLLRSEPQIALYDRASAGVRVVFRRGSGRGDEPGRFAAIGAALDGTVYAE